MFVCALRSMGAPLPEAELLAHTAFPGSQRLARREREEASPFAGLVAEGAEVFRSLSARWRGLVGIGDVRLDNRDEIMQLGGMRLPASASDLQVVLAALDGAGEAALWRLLGDFGFAVWDARAQKLLAVRDAFGVKPLYYAVHEDLLMVASRSDLLAGDEQLDGEFIADFLIGLNSATDHTIWKGVRAVPAGSYLVQRGTHRELKRYWAAARFTPETGVLARDSEERFRELLREGVRSRLDGPAVTWAQLSGGLDSSTVAALAQLIGGGRGLAGTITVVDTLGNGDERRYSDAVVRRYDLRNEQVRDYWAWQDDGIKPPLTDGPRPLYPFFARDRRMCEIVRKAGGRVLLSGLGSDHYLYGNLHYIADLAAKGRIVAAVRELALWSVATRQSFWSMARQHLVDPLFRGRRGAAADGDLPPWIDPRFARAMNLGDRLPRARMAADPAGTRFARQVARDVGSLAAWIDRWPYGEDVEVRYPFLYRPLVEAALQLPPNARVRPATHKWVLREATRDVLPEEVRTRNSKGTIDARILWSLERERARLDALLGDPMLAQLGYIRTDELRAGVDRARRGVRTNNAHLMLALSLETWLSVRSGRWAVQTHAAPSAA